MPNISWLIVGLVGLGAIGIAIWKLSSILSTAQLTKVQEWLLYAVSEAEIALGSGTGVLKLRMVYDMFTERFPSWVPKLSFEAFGGLVNAALERMKSEIEKNPKVKTVIEGEV